MYAVHYNSLHGRLSQPVALTIIRAGELPLNPLVKAEFPEVRPELGSTIRTKDLRDAKHMEPGRQLPGHILGIQGTQLVLSLIHI